MTYPGGKGAAGVVQTIINQQPPHVHYVEPFLGGGAVMRVKRQAIQSTAIDLDERPIRAFAAFAPSSFSLLIEDGVQWLFDHARNLSSDTLIYCDPPYVMKTRRSQRILYREEFSVDDHWNLLRVLRSLRCMVQVSGYWCKLYAEELSEWRLIRFQSMTRHGLREECLWMNYPEPEVLHDYRFLGRDFRERERIKRKAQRWTDRIDSLPRLERLAIFERISARLGMNGDAAARVAGDIVASGDSRRPTSANSTMRDLKWPLTPETAMRDLTGILSPETTVLE